MSDIDKNSFKNPERHYCVNPIMHAWPEKNRTEMMDAIKAYGFGGVVTNPSHKNGFTTNPDNISDFKNITDELGERKLSFWIYDENGYPSGYAGGLTLEGHPELEAKGLYMRRRIAYEARHTSFTLDEESDRIVWAAKYPLETPGMHESFVQFEKMEPVLFSDTYCECDLEEKEALFIFCVKPAYEGSHCTHNVCSYSRYINIMNPKAVRRFIELCFEPIAARIPDAYEKAYSVFTDEPSLQVGYARSYEVWPYALAPWEDGLFDEFEKEYGFSLLPYLPLIFEGQSNAYPIRVKFYDLVGKMIAKAYSGQLAEWCEAHGGKFSGHYLGEESMVSHVKDYGSNIEVMKAASYPGIDVLACYPEIYCYNTAKHAQMVARKKGTNGMMAEICPFVDVPNFSKDPIENMTGVMGLLYLGGVRITNSYFSADYASYDPDKFGAYTGYMKQKEAIAFNNYVGRLGYMLDGIMNDCGIFIYYGIEDVQAKMQPSYNAFAGPETEADKHTYSIAKRIYEAGHDFYYADREDIVNAAKSISKGYPVISGCKVDTVIIPSLDVMHDDAYAALAELRKAGVEVIFIDKLPCYGTGMSGIAYEGTDWSDISSLKDDTAAPDNTFIPVSQEDVMNYLENKGEDFTAEADGTMLIKAKFNRNGREMYFVDNNTRCPAKVLLKHKYKNSATIYDPVNGDIYTVEMGGKVTIASFRGVFVVFD